MNPAASLREISQLFEYCKGKGFPIICQAGIEGRQRFSSTRTQYQRYRGAFGQRHAPAALPQTERHCFHSTGGPSEYVNLYIFSEQYLAYSS
jgi:hypothetical protein